MVPEPACVFLLSVPFQILLMDERLTQSLGEARMGLEVWRKEYNTEGPHGALGMKTPTEFAAEWRPPEQANACS
jgi:transposase InsO family protein